MILSYTGLRIGEAAQLDWADVNFEDGTIHVRDLTTTGVAQEKDRTAKGKKGRFVPMHRNLHAFLLESPRKGSKVLAGPRGGCLKSDVVRKALIDKILPRVARQLYPSSSNPGLLQGRLHSFRHHFVTLAYRAGWRERMILDVIGHENSRITRLYRNLEKGEHRDAMNQINPLDDGTGAM